MVKYYSKDEIFDFLTKNENIKYTKELFDYINISKAPQLLNKPIEIEDIEMIELLLKVINTKDNENYLKNILKKAYKEKNRKIIRVFEKNGIKLSFFERVF